MIMVAAMVLAPIAAQADVASDVAAHVVSFLGLSQSTPTMPAPVIEVARPATQLTSRPVADAQPSQDIAAPSAPSIPAVTLASPTVETPLHRLFCVEYARAVSGLAIFGDAKLWWEHARNLYSRASHPVEEAVMVFSGSKRLKRGHVAVVTDIVSSREIRVDQANWQNHGEIDHATPVLDVSRQNDWSQVRVWDMHSQTFGAHVYAISGFIAKDLVRQASND